MIQNGRPVWVKTTNKKGKIKEDATLGLSYFYATHDGYFPAELGAYVNFKRNYIVVELEKDDRIAETTPPVFDSSSISTTDLEIIVEIETHLEQELKPDFDTTAIAELPPSFAELDKENFDAAHFKPINVVFVLDVSSSMKQVDKIELMKYSLFQLTDMLRPQDKIGIVTYASDARVLLNTTPGDQKERIKKEVSELKAFGYTAGGSGIKLGFRQAKRAMIPNGKNQVIVITDGAFNRNSEDYKKYVKKYLKKGIHMSVVGIKNKSVDEQKMRNAAVLGGGHYVPIMKLSDAQHNLKQEIRMLTYKH
jgi:Ca-activated chloride channel family protein